jgi:hypothetical protein
VLRKSKKAALATAPQSTTQVTEGGTFGYAQWRWGKETFNLGKVVREEKYSHVS